MLVVGGPSRTKRNLTGTGTSRTDSSSTASCSRTNAMVGCSRKSTLPGGCQDMTVNIRTALLAWKGEGKNGYGVREITHPQGRRWLLHFQESSPAASAHVWIWTDAYRTPGSAPSAVMESSRRSKIKMVKNSRSWDSFGNPLTLTCTSFFSMSMRVSASTVVWSVPMSGSVTNGSG